jgi:hypothetical protein
MSIGDMSVKLSCTNLLKTLSGQGKVDSDL